MPATPFIQRAYDVDGQPLRCRFFRAESEGQSFYCRYEIDWAEGARNRKVYGVDEVQALLLAMQAAHTDLLAAREHNGRQVTWLEDRSLGLPISRTIREWDPENRF